MVNNRPKSSRAEELDRSFQALAHTARRSILDRLAAGPTTVGEATRGTGLSKPAISKHLNVLEQAGLINRTVRGRTHVLSLRAAPLDDATGWIERHRRLWEQKLDVIDEFLAERQ